MPLPTNFRNIINKDVVEQIRVECKKGWNPLEVVESVCSFANDIDNFGGGYIIIGAEYNQDADRYVFYDFSKKQLDDIQKELTEYCLKSIKPQYVPVSDIVEYEGKHFIVIWAYSGYDRPYKCLDRPNDPKHSKEIYYVRKGSTAIKALGSLERELLDLGSKEPFDDRLNYHAEVSDLSETLLQEYLRRADSNLLKFPERGKLDLLKDLHAIGGPEEAIHPRNFALLLFSNAPEKYMPYSYIDLAIIKSASGRDIIEKRFSGSIIAQYDGAMLYLKNNVVETMVVKEKGEEASRRYANYPIEALDEILANAILHKDYSEPQPISIRIEPDFISITSYPGFDRSIREKDIVNYEIRSERYRNRRLAEFLKELHIVEAHNTGIPTILDACDENDSDYPTFLSDEERSFLTVRLPINKRFLPNATQKRDLQPQIISLLQSGDLTLTKLSRALGYEQIPGALKRTLKIMLANGKITILGKKYHLA
ncbi:MAG: putative DNA binding domain-containing protein [Bacilli bacterium]|nr:putative DNA binding domain-containing protein [Bacilli bacterium]